MLHLKEVVVVFQLFPIVHLSERPATIKIMAQYRFTGHETFPCRYPWLPKAVAALRKHPDLFKDIDKAIVVLGVGKQMARAIKFWVEAAKFVEKQEKGDFKITRLGKKLFGAKGRDPYLEDVQTLWLIHWNFSAHLKSPIFAWDFLMNQWQDPEIFPPSVIQAFKEKSDSQGRNLSWATLKQHFNIFLHTYVPTRGQKAVVLEDNLDCPLIELDLIRKVGERVSDSNGKREHIYTFNREPKPQISQQLFFYCLNDFWETYHSEEKSLQFHQIASGHGSPGQIFKFSEVEIRTRLEDIKELTNGVMSFRESVNQRHIQKDEKIKSEELFDAIYVEED